VDSEPQADPARPPALSPVPVNLPRIVTIGTAAWLVALVVTLVVPSLHRGDHDWWPWAALCGALLGLVGLGYLHRGRGNIADR
jgi:Protein of unknown function (DUF2530)